MTTLAAVISGRRAVTSVEPRDRQHQVQKCGTSLSPLISSPHTSIGRAESLYRSVMSTPRYVRVAPVSFVEIMVAGAGGSFRQGGPAPLREVPACSARLREAYTEL